MRNIVLLLVLLNLMVLGYQRWILQPAESTGNRSADLDVPALQLVNQPVETQAAEAELKDLMRCLRLGPFASQDSYIAVQRELRKKGAQVSQSSAEGQIWVGHWAQVRDQGSRAKAEQARDRLAANDLDTFILPDTEVHALSLGIYRKRASAEQIIRKARRLGFKTLMVDRFQPGTIYWLQVNMADGGALQPGEFQGDSGQILRTETVPCDSV
jgi:hypothetical protein